MNPTLESRRSEFRALLAGGSEADFEAVRESLPRAFLLEWAPDAETAGRRLARDGHELCVVLSEADAAKARAHGYQGALVTLEGEPWLAQLARADAESRRAACLLDACSDPLIEARRDGHILYMNPAAERAFPALRAAAGSHAVFSGIESDWEGEREIRSGVYFYRERVQARGDRLLIQCTDITERRLVEARLTQAERLASVGELAAGVAHEANNPLTYLIANLALLEEQLPSGTDGRLLSETREAADRIRKVIRDLRTFSRPAAQGELAAEGAPGSADVEAAVEAAARMASNEIRHRAALVRDYAPVPAVAGDEGRLAQVFLNLLVNAAQAIPAGDAESNEIRVRVRQEASGEIAVEIRDTGPGISSENLERVFEPFFTTKPADSGTGLGLPICRAIIESMGGRISVSSAPGKGASFRVILKAAPAAAAKIEPGAIPVFPLDESILSAKPAVKRGRVLVIDDEAGIASALLAALSRDHEVEVRTSGREGLALALESDFDVIFCDVMMPDLTGMELYERVRSTRPGVELRIVLMTGGAFTPEAREFLDRCPNFRLDKPFDLSAVRRLVAERIRKG